MAAHFVNAKKHLHGKHHQRVMRAHHNTVTYCSLCCVHMPNETTRTQHLHGRAHKLKIQLETTVEDQQKDKKSRLLKNAAATTAGSPHGNLETNNEEKWKKKDCIKKATNQNILTNKETSQAGETTATSKKLNHRQANGEKRETKPEIASVTATILNDSTAFSKESLSTTGKPQGILFRFVQSPGESAVEWKLALPEDAIVLWQELVVTEKKENNTSACKFKVRLKPSRSSFGFSTVPGSAHVIRLTVLCRKGNREYDICGTASCKAICEVEPFLQLALAYAKDKMLPLTQIYRCKRSSYWNNIRKQRDGVMETYLKDNNGHTASPINGVLKGLFFMTRTYPDGKLPVESPFGNERMIVPAVKLLDPQRVNYYFTDFYCNQRPFFSTKIKSNRSASHYVTVVICERGSSADTWCHKRLIRMDPFHNNFLRASAENPDVFHANRAVWVEVFYTENIPLDWAALFDDVQTFGTGSSKKDGLPHNKRCTVCNLCPLGAPQNKTCKGQNEAVQVSKPPVRRLQPNNVQSAFTVENSTEKVVNAPRKTKDLTENNSVSASAEHPTQHKETSVMQRSVSQVAVTTTVEQGAQATTNTANYIANIVDARSNELINGKRHGTGSVPNKYPTLMGQPTDVSRSSFQSTLNTAV
jgi:hypothetical protein